MVGNGLAVRVRRDHAAPLRRPASDRADRGARTHRPAGDHAAAGALCRPREPDRPAREALPWRGLEVAEHSEGPVGNVHRLADAAETLPAGRHVVEHHRRDPIADIRTCWHEVRAFAIKDHRNWPKDQDCGPGFGEIDHYKLLQPVLRTGLTIPLACENIFEPLVPRPGVAEGVDALARRAREYIQAVVRGLTDAAAAV